MKYVLFDTETTGNTELDRIIQVGAMVLDSEEHYANDEYCENIFDRLKNNIKIYNELCKADVDINFCAMEVHNITPEMLKNKPSFKQTEFYKILEENNSSDNYLIAHNIKFDLGMLEKEGFKNNYKLIDTYKCAKVVFESEEFHRLQYLRYSLGLYKLEENEAKKLNIEIKAHDAIGDVLVMKLLLDKLLEHKSYEELHEISKKPVLINKFTFGKHKGKSFEDVYTIDPGYLTWAVSKLDDEDIVYSIRNFLTQR